MSRFEVLRGYANKFEVYVHYFYCKSGRFADNLLGKGQTILYNGFNLHFHNVIEEHIRDVQDQAILLLLCAKERWHEAITSNLRSYAIRNANDDICTILDKPDGTSKLVQLVRSEKKQVEEQTYFFLSCIRFTK